jgi:uncharacterized protein DUF6603
MATGAGSLATLVRAVATALRETGEWLGSGTLPKTVARLGYDLPGDLAAQPDFVAAAAAVSEAAAGLGPKIDALTAAVDGEEDPAGIFARGEELLAGVRGVLDGIGELGARIDSVQLADQAGGFARVIVDHLLIEYLAARAPLATEVLSVLGLLDRTTVRDEETGTSFVHRALNPGNLPALLGGPAEYLTDLYGWGDPGFDGVELLGRLRRLIVAGLGRTATLVVADDAPATLEAYLFGLRAEDDADLAEHGGDIPGLVASLRFPAVQDTENTFAVGPRSRVEVTTSARFDADVRAVIRPPLSVEALPPGDTTVTAEIIARLVGERTGDVVTLLDAGGLARLVARRVTASFGLRAVWDPLAGTARATPALELRLDGAGLAAGGGDAFVRSLTRNAPVDGEFDLALGWTADRGLYMEGNGSLTARIPIGFSAIPFVDVDAVEVAVDLDGQAVTGRAGLEFGAHLGPLRATVVGMGVDARLTFPEHGGNLGVADLALDFAPPEGVALSMVSGPLRGGGFLDHDPETGEYSGVLQLGAGKLLFSAIGLLSTRRPDGEPGFSLVLLITGDFRPVRLGYGFTLNGIGGIVGINRTTDVAALQQGMRAGALGSVMFPERVAENAPRILSDLRTYFPESYGGHLFGPMIQLGWGPVPVLEAELGLILELPDPLRLIVIGRVRMGLPSLRTPLGRFNLDVLGVLDFDAGTLAIDARLFDSRIGPITIDGDAAVRARWKGDPDFALSIGGFHPRFRPPAGFPALRRVSLNLTRGNNPRVRLLGYLALTSNSVQFGARIEAYAAWRKFSVEGHLSFDALFRFDPFGFVVDVAAGAAIKRSGRTLLSVDLKLRVSGPRPWHVAGTASFRILVRVTIHVDLTVGSRPSIEPAERIDLGALLAEELVRPASWTAQLPPDGGSAVTLRDTPAGSDVVAVHPQSRLEVRQTLCPLGEKLDKYGERALAYSNEFAIAAVRIGGDAVEHAAVRDRFAPAQYFDLTDTQRLAVPGYRSYDSGVTLNPAGATSGDRVSMRPHYEQVVVDSTRGYRQKNDQRVPLPDGALVKAHRRTAAAAVAGFRERTAVQPAPRRLASPRSPA